MEGKIFLVHAVRGDIEAMKEALKQGVDVNYTNVHGENALFYAASQNLAVVKFLTEAGAQPMKTQSDQTVVHVAAAQGKVDILEYFFSTGVSLSSNSYDGSTPLHLAVKGGSLEAAEFCIKNGASINKPDYGGFAALHHACSKGGKATIVQLLVDNGAKIDKKTYVGDTPLHLAAKRGDIDAITILIEYGATLGCKNCGKGKCPVVKEQTLNTIKELVEARKGMKPKKPPQAKKTFWKK